MDVISVNFCKTSDMVPHNILSSELKRYGLDGWTVTWNCLDDHAKELRSMVPCPSGNQ